MRTWAWLTVVAATLVGAGVVGATVPATILYQGKLTDDTGCERGGGSRQ